MRLDGADDGHQRKLLRAEQIADELRNQPQPTPAAGRSPPASGTPQGGRPRWDPPPRWGPPAPPSSRDSYSEGLLVPWSLHILLNSQHGLHVCSSLDPFTASLVLLKSEHGLRHIAPPSLLLPWSRHILLNSEHGLPSHCTTISRIVISMCVLPSIVRTLSQIPSLPPPHCIIALMLEVRQLRWTLHEGRQFKGGKDA